MTGAAPVNDTYRAGNITIRRATAADDGALRQVLRDNTMQGWVRLALEREPSYFAGGDLAGHDCVVIGEDRRHHGAIVGMYHVAFMPAWVNGEPVPVAYLGSLRINPGYRHRFGLLKHGFASIRPLTAPDSTAARYWFTSISSDNEVARRLLEANRPGLPRYTPVSELHTLAMSVRHAQRPALLRAARPADVPAICDFHAQQARGYQFAPRLTPGLLNRLCDSGRLSIGDFRLLEDRGTIAACVAVWDQRRFKQACVRGYRFPLNYLRPAYNLYAWLRRRPPLPRPGKRLDSVYLAFFGLAPAAHGIASEILREALHSVRALGGRIGLLGLAGDHPVRPAVEAVLHPAVYRTWIETVSWQDPDGTPLHGAPAQPEIALL